MITLAHITRTFGRTVAATLMAGGLVASWTVKPADACGAFGMCGGPLFNGVGIHNGGNRDASNRMMGPIPLLGPLFGGVIGPNANNSWSTNSSNSGWNANARIMPSAFALGAMALDSGNEGNSRISGLARNGQAGWSPVFHPYAYGPLPNYPSHALAGGPGPTIPFDPSQAQRPPSAQVQITHVGAPPSDLQVPAGRLAGSIGVR